MPDSSNTCELAPAPLKLDVSLDARVPAVEKLIGLEGDEARPLLKGGMLAPHSSFQYWQLETFGVEGMAYVPCDKIGNYCHRHLSVQQKSALWRYFQRHATLSTAGRFIELLRALRVYAGAPAR